MSGNGKAGTANLLFKEAPQNTKRRRISMLLLILFSFTAFAEENNSKNGFLDFNVYPYLSDVGGDNSITISAFSKFDNRFSYFGFANFSNQGDSTELSDIVGFYTEQNVRWQISKNSPFDLTAQLNFRSGEDNDRHRLGVRWRLNNTESLSAFFRKIHLNYAVNLHAVQFDKQPGNVWQLEHTFRLAMPYWSDRLYLAGFIDHTFNEDNSSGVPDNAIVGEAQFGYRMIENLFLIAEYRVNEYRRSDVNNLAIGFEYKIKW